MVKGTVVGPFRVIGEATTGKLPAFQMVAEALAADPLALARIVAAVARGKITGFVALHEKLLLNLAWPRIEADQRKAGKHRQTRPFGTIKRSFAMQGSTNLDFAHAGGHTANRPVRRLHFFGQM
jgi:hypothetical protein